MAIYHTLRAQLDGTRYSAHRVVLDKLEALPQGLSKAKASAIAKGTLNQKGVEDAVREYASKHVAAELHHEMKRLGDARKSLAKRQNALTIPASDPTDFAGAILRSDIRKHLSSLDATKRSSLLTINPDAAVLAAVFEAPSFLTGVDANLKARAESAFAETNFPVESAKLREDAEALDVLDMALEATRKNIRETMGLTDMEFEKWMTTNAPPSDGEGV